MSLSLTKMAVLTGYANTISLKEFAKNRLFLVTPAGMISGIPVFDEENSNPNIAVAQTVNSSALKAVSKAASAEEESPQTGESCEFILLKDARLETTSPVVNFPVLTGYANTISLKEFAKNRLFLVTPAGMISGIPVFDEENSNPNIAVAQTVNSSALKAVSKAASAEEESPQTGESCEFILLKDARLETTSPVVNFPVLTVFCDQIIAVTLGTDLTNG